MNQYERKIGHAAIQTFGRIPNIIKAIEELSELQQALCKHIVAPNDAMIVENVHEEIAHVQMMVNRLLMLFDPTEVQDWKERTMEKMAKLLELDDENDGDAVGAAMRRPPEGERGADLIRHGCAAPPSRKGKAFGEASECDKCARRGPCETCEGAEAPEGPEEPTGEALEEMRL